MQTYIVIADGSRASLYSRSGSAKELDYLETWNNEGGRTPDHVSESDRLGSSGGGHSSVMGSETDPKRHSQQVFAKTLAAVLKERQSQYKRLVLVASHKFLGDLRQNLDPAVARKVTGEFAKDLTHVSIHDLPQHLEKLESPTPV